MKRLLNSLAGAAGDLSDYAADRVDGWAANLRGAPAPHGEHTPEQPGEFDDDPEGWRDRAAIAEAALESTRESRDAAYVALEHIEHLADLVTDGHDLAAMGSDPNTALGKMHAAIVRDRKRAADRIATLEKQLAAHHEHEAHVDEQLGIIARAIAGIPEADAEGDMPVGERVRAALLAVTGRANELQSEVDGVYRVVNGVVGGTIAPDFMAPLDTLGHRVLAAARVLIDTAAAMANTEAAARIRAAADEYEHTASADGTRYDIGADAYVAGMREAARVAADETPEADPGVAHIDTVNGRQRPAQATESPGERYVDLAVTRDTEELE